MFDPELRGGNAQPQHRVRLSNHGHRDVAARLRGTIGNGGRELNLSTVNGSIKVLRGE